MTSQHFSAIFSDMEMPQVDGMQLLSAIGSSDHEPKPPVIIISSRDESEFRDTAADLGAQDYLIKPLADNDLDHAIESTASLRHLSRAAGEVGRGAAGPPKEDSGREGAVEP